MGLAILLSPAAMSAREERFSLGPPLRFDADDKPIPEPRERFVSEIWDMAHNTWLRHLDLGYLGLKMADRPALDTNAWDEVPDSSWFVNRIGLRAVSVEELLAGAPGIGPRPGKWEVNRLKTQGYTPGVRFRDSAGEGFLLKLDLPNSPERNSAADKIGSLLMHAAGYYAPQNTIVYFRPPDLVLADGAQFEDLLGRRRPMTKNDLEAVIATLPRREDGSIRALASHYLPGPPKGPFPYWGTREDDPNDLIPHELRRELRGLRVIASWFNHVDVKEVNTLDVYVQAGGGGHLRHYFIDFGSTMGSGNFMDGPNRVGHEYLFDGSTTFKSLGTFGAWERPWDRDCVVEFSEVGHFELAHFDPQKWKPNYPNLAFLETDESDAYWGAKIVTAFTDELIRALVSGGQYSRPEVEAQVERTLRGRRDAIGRYWFDVVSPLEDFTLEAREGPTWTLRFRDLAVERRYASREERAYGIQVLRSPQQEVPMRMPAKSSGFIDFLVPAHFAPTASDRFGRAILFAVDVSTKNGEAPWALPVRVFIGLDGTDDEPHVLGWKHAPH